MLSSPSATLSCRGESVTVAADVPLRCLAGIVICRFEGTHAAV